MLSTQFPFRNFKVAALNGNLKNVDRRWVPDFTAEEYTAENSTAENSTAEYSTIRRNFTLLRLYGGVFLKMQTLRQNLKKCGLYGVVLVKTHILRPVAPD